MSEQLSKQIQSTKEIQNLVQIMRSQNSSTSAELAKVKDELKDVKAENKTLSEKLMKCNEDFMVLNDAHEAAGSEVAAVQEELAKANEDLAHYKNTVESALAEIKKLWKTHRFGPLKSTFTRTKQEKMRP